MRLQDVNFRVGDEQVRKVFLGDTQVWWAPMNSLKDDFSTVRNDLWKVNNGSELVINDGRLQIAAEGSYGTEVDSRDVYRTVDDEFIVQVFRAPDTEAYIGLYSPDNTVSVYIDILTDNAQIGLQNPDGSYITLVPWDPAKNWLMWEISFNTVTAYFSGDCVHWTLIGSRSWPFEQGRINLGGGMSGGVTEFANVNMRPKVRMYEPFDALDTVNVWDLTYSDPARVQVVNGQLQITCDNTWPGIVTRQPHSLVNATVEIELVQVTQSTTNSADTWFALDSGGSANIFGPHMDVINDNLRLYFYINNAGNYVEFAVIPYDPALHRWLRFRHDGATVHYEASPDRKSWSQLGSWPLDASYPPLDNLFIQLGCGSNATEIPTIYDNLVWSQNQ